MNPFKAHRLRPVFFFPLMATIFLRIAISTAWANPELIGAIENNDYKKIVQLIRDGVDLNESINVEVKDCAYVGNVLCLAAAYGNLEIVRLLIQHGMDPNAFANGLLPLHVAARRGHLEIVKMLIGEYGTDPLTLTESGHGQEPALHFAATGNHVEVVQYLLDLAPDSVNCLSAPDYPELSRTPLRNAFNKFAYDVVKLLLSYNANPNFIDGTGDSYLHLACKDGKADIVQLLLEHPDFDHNLVNALNSDSQTPLQLASSNPEIVALLTQHGATLIEPGNQQGEAALPDTENQQDKTTLPDTDNQQAALPDTENQQDETTLPDTGNQQAALPDTENQQDEVALLSTENLPGEAAALAATFAAIQKSL